MGTAPATRALQDPHKDIGSVKPCALKSLGWGLWPPPKALSHQSEICRDFKRSFEEPGPTPLSITERTKTSLSNVTSLETVDALLDADSWNTTHLKGQDATAFPTISEWGSHELGTSPEKLYEQYSQNKTTKYGTPPISPGA